MKGNDLRIELQALFKKYGTKYNLSDSDCSILAITTSMILSADDYVKMRYYETMKRFSEERQKELMEQADKIITTMNLTDEEKEKLLNKVKADAKANDKISN